MNLIAGLATAYVTVAVLTAIVFIYVLKRWYLPAIRRCTFDSYNDNADAIGFGMLAGALWPAAILYVYGRSQCRPVYARRPYPDRLDVVIQCT